MARVGRPRKAGPRDSSGKLKKPSLQQIKELEAKMYRENMQTVANQPHRRNAPDPLDRRLVSELGQFCIARKLRSELFDAGEEWATILRCWRAAKGVPDPLHGRSVGGGLGPSDATVEGWERLVRRIEKALGDEGRRVWLATRSLCIDGVEPFTSEAEYAILGLQAVASELGRLPRSAHPFLRAA